jgi:hypothetical protein
VARLQPSKHFFRGNELDVFFISNSNSLKGQRSTNKIHTKYTMESLKYGKKKNKTSKT